MAENQVSLTAPLSGVLTPLNLVPDPVFAEKMVGDGIAIDPLSSVLLSPCDGEVLQMHDSWHAVTIRTAQGVEVLMHVGLDTVMLKSEGFLAHVKTGDTVKTGDRLLEFDPDYIAIHAQSLLTMVLVSNGEMVSSYNQQSGEVTAGKDTIMNLSLSGLEAEAETSGEALKSDPITIPNKTGLHARPAAVLANMARRYKGSIKLLKNGDSANAKSVVSIMSLNVEYNDELRLAASGSDAEDALAMLVPMIKNGLGEDGATPATATGDAAAIGAPGIKPRSDDPNILLGITASPGLAVGTVYQVHSQDFHVEEKGEDPAAERSMLDEAIGHAMQELEAIQAKLHAEADPDKAMIFAAHQELLEDPELLESVYATISSGKSASFAWKQGFSDQAEVLAKLENELIAARANDLRDVGQRVLAKLTGTELEKLEVPENSILIAEDLTPSDTANFDRSKVLGFATTLGGATSHVAILARSFDIPAVAGIEARALEIENGTPVILDGSKASLCMNPPPEEMERIRTRQAEHAEKHQADLAAAFDPAVTSDGHEMEIAANISGLADAEKSMELGGMGVGLLRSEFLFQDRATPPDEEEQINTYNAIAHAVAGKPLIIRTLDVGGDKPLPYIPIPPEDNPFLGERGIRIGLNRPEILRTQIRAILRASAGQDIHLMFPMIATLSEFRTAKMMVEEEREKLGVEQIPVGIMVEIPAAALLSEQFAGEADFFSIGTNDLTQYTLAMDRGHAKLAPQVDGLDPSVLKLINLTVKGAHAHNKWVGVCGSIAGDPQAIPILTGLGIKELSVSVPAIPGVKAQVRNMSFEQCKTLAEKALACDTAAEVRALVNETF